MTVSKQWATLSQQQFLGGEESRYIIIRDLLRDLTENDSIQTMGYSVPTAISRWRRIQIYYNSGFAEGLNGK